VRATDRKALLDVTSGSQVVRSFSVAPIADALRGKVTDLQAPRSLNVRVGQRLFVTVLTPDLASGGYSIEVPELPGVLTKTATIPEARKMAADAIRLWSSAADSASRRRAR
jgi:predicted RNase H-like HicB family nuclease